MYENARLPLVVDKQTDDRTFKDEVGRGGYVEFLFLAKHGYDPRKS
jgi:hypothetical protein